MSSPDTPADRAYVATRLAQMDRQLDQARDAMLAELDLYRDDWSTRHAEMMRAYSERIRKLDEDQKQWLTRFLNGEADEPAPTQDVAQGQVAGASAAGSSPPAGPGGPGSGQPNPYAAELERAQAIRDMPMDEYAKRRAELGVRSATDMSRRLG